MKNDLKRYHKSILSKDYYISFFWGLGAGLTIYFFILIIPPLLEKNYLLSTKLFILYLLIGTIIFLVGRFILLKCYGKDKS